MQENNTNSLSTSTLAAAIWPKVGVFRDAIFVMAGSLLLAGLSQVAVPFWPVPLTCQTLGVMLVGAVLGRTRGALSVLAYLAQGTAGLPFFAHGTSGPAVLMGPTGGYLIGFILAAYLIGWLTEKGFTSNTFNSLVTMLLGCIAVYAPGLLWLSLFTGWANVLQAGFYPFLLGDLLKISIATFMIPCGWLLFKR